MTAARPGAAALLVIVLSGCGGPAAPEATTEVEHDRLAWTGCEGVTVVLYGPSLVYAGAVPPGWEDPLQPVSHVQLDLHRCERVSWGPFERGPVTILAELHFVFAEPEACMGGAKVGAMLQSIWFSDAELAAYARGRHGMPAHAAEFNATERSPAAGAEWEWTWTAPGGKESRIVLAESDGGPDSAMPDYTTRVFWPRGAAASLMDLSKGYAHDEAARLLAHGALQPPLLHGSLPVPDFATAQASRRWDAHAAASIVHFRDASCAGPA